MHPKFQRRKRGQAISEYLILVALVAVASIGVIQVLSSNLRLRLGRVAAQLGGQDMNRRAERVEEEHYQIRDLGDFGNATKDVQGHSNGD